MTSVFRLKSGPTEPSDAMIFKTASKLGISPDVLHAVIAVEASGRWYNSDGTFIRRLEPHHLKPHIQSAVGFSGTWRDSLRISTYNRRRMFSKAFDMDPENACYASSWGAFQFMGFNAKRCGYASALEMCQAFENGPSEQLNAFVNFVRFIGADTDLRAQDWRAFAVKYNGSGQPDVYAKKLRSAYARQTGGGSPEILMLGSKGRSVTELQKALITRGYRVVVDADFGPATYEAVRAFQTDNNLVVDGKVGAMTWKALRDTSAYSPKPEMPATEKESLLDKTTAITGATSAATGGLTAILGDSPSDTVRIVLIVAISALALIAGGAWYLSRKSSKDRLHSYRLGG